MEGGNGSLNKKEDRQVEALRGARNYLEFIYCRSSVFLWVQIKDQIVPEFGAERVACGREEWEGFFSLEVEDCLLNNPISLTMPIY